MKIFIATPAFDGKTYVQYTCALARTIDLLVKNGIQYQIAINTSGSLLVAERNRINKMFLQSECTHMLCIDSDLGWPEHAVLGMLKHDVDFVAGLYPCRHDKAFIFRPVYGENKSLVKNENGLLKMEYIPAGFMLIKRNVIEKMHAVFSFLYFEPKQKEMKNENGYCLFNTELIDGEFWGEDYVFCRRAREAGFEIWVDPLIEFDHAGQIGCVLSTLTNDQNNVKKDEEKKEG